MSWGFEYMLCTLWQKSVNIWHKVLNCTLNVSYLSFQDCKIISHVFCTASGLVLFVFIFWTVLSPALVDRYLHSTCRYSRFIFRRSKVALHRVQRLYQQPAARRSEDCSSTLTVAVQRTDIIAVVSSPSLTAFSSTSLRVSPSCPVLAAVAAGVRRRWSEPGSIYAVRTLHVGTYNICSAPGKIGSIHNILSEFDLDILALCETCIKHDDPPAVMRDIVPDGYSVIHVHRSPLSNWPAGGGLAVVFHDSLAVKPHSLSPLLSPTTFELQLVKITATSPAVTLVNIYWPPQMSTSDFVDELSDVSMTIMSVSDHLLVCGDFNCSGSTSDTINPALVEVLDMDMKQHIQSPTRGDNILDLLAADSSLSVADVRMDNTGLVSDHRLVITTVSARRRTLHAVPKSFQSIRNIDTAEFERPLRSSPLFTSPDPTINGYTDQMERIVVAELDHVAPLQHCRRWLSKPITRWLSQDAVNAKRDGGCLERRWRRTKSDADSTAYRQACRRANKLINTSRRDFYRGQLESAVDSRDRWKLTQRLLHSSDLPIDRTELENVKFCASFSDYFADKINKLKQAVATQKSSSTANPTADRLDSGPRFSTLRPVSFAKVYKVIGTLSPKSSPLDFIPTSLIKRCSSVLRTSL